MTPDELAKLAADVLAAFYRGAWVIPVYGGVTRRVSEDVVRDLARAAYRHLLEVERDRQANTALMDRVVAANRELLPHQTDLNRLQAERGTVEIQLLRQHLERQGVKPKPEATMEELQRLVEQRAAAERIGLRPLEPPHSCPKCGYEFAINKPAPNIGADGVYCPQCGARQ